MARVSLIALQMRRPSSISPGQLKVSPQSCGKVECIAMNLQGKIVLRLQTVASGRFCARALSC